MSIYVRWSILLQYAWTTTGAGFRLLNLFLVQPCGMDYVKTLLKHFLFERQELLEIAESSNFSQVLQLFSGKKGSAINLICDGRRENIRVFFFIWCGLSQQTIYSLTSAYRRSKRILVRPVQLDILCIDANIFRRVHWENRYISRPHQRLLPRIQVLVGFFYTEFQILFIRMHSILPSPPPRYFLPFVSNRFVRLLYCVDNLKTQYFLRVN